MDIILNEKSIDGQFTKRDFVSYMGDEIIPCMKKMEETGCTLFKSYDTYKRMVTENISLGGILREWYIPEIIAFKRYLVQLYQDEPFWNTSIQTKNDVEYKSVLDELPNCITEAYERNGAVFSFMHHGFLERVFELQCNGKTAQVKNFYDEDSLSDILHNLGFIDVWNRNSFYILDGKYKFEIRYREDNHNAAHFHISCGGYGISLSIPDADTLAGELPGGNERKVVAWALRNMDKIRELWNRIHPERKV